MKISTKEITLVSIFTALTAIGAGISIPVGEVPITMQTLFVLLSGLILGPRLGALSQIIYIMLGLIGIPVFAGFSGGVQSMIKPSFGFMIGFVFAAYIVGKIAYSTKGLSRRKIWIGSLIGTIVIYIFGLPYMYYILNITLGKNLDFLTIFKIGCLIFLPGDLLKLAVASIVSIKILPRLHRQNLDI